VECKIYFAKSITEGNGGQQKHVTHPTNYKENKMATKNTYEMNDLKGVLNSDRAIALIAITAHQQSTLEACLSDEQLAAFVNGELKGEPRQTLLAHLNSCSQCYHHWLDTASYLKSLGTSQKRLPF